MTPIKVTLAAALAATLLLPATAMAEPGKGQGGGKDKVAAAHGGHGKGGAPGHGAAKKAAPPAAAVDRRGPAARDAVAVAPGRRVSRTVRVDDFFDRNDEALIRRYFGTSVSCPPGLAAKNNGCLPPGQAKKAYGVGTILPRDIYLSPLPGDLLGRLPIAPDGYYYGRYNGDVYLVENTTRRIIDTIVFNLLR